ncbi:MAG: sigma 54-interacting transcriptional regulator [Lentihominibacter sp.]|nr:sigma 54-interacting transcriptional regulator [Clostridiales bacterium]MDY2680344.1 sigma 54-interacting transcriptional regulator [Lentihominibacter sp.]
MSLLLIKDTVQQVATAITAALDLETEIIDENLMIIGGTGRYREKTGSYEEDGDLECGLVYADCLRTGREYINFNPEHDEFYDARENELAEICCPIRTDDKVLGLIGLIAFTEEQRNIMIHKTLELRTFLQSMAELIAGKYIVSQNNITLQNTVSSLLESQSVHASFDSIISRSTAMEKIKKRALQVASSNSTVLITGESGTGKGLLARAIHKESPRCSKPFVSVNCAAIPETLLESELFGYERGAFTGAEKNGKLGKFQLADKGTLFLDEIGDMPLHLQVKLLSCLQNRQVDPVGAVRPVDVDVRIIAATNKDLEEMILQNQFREDLYFRLNVIPLYIPPLRERPEDISMLVQHIIMKFSMAMGKAVTGIEADAMDVLLSYSWPGNIREVENVIEYAINMEQSDTITVDSLPEKLVRKNKHVNSGSGTGMMHINLKTQLDSAERLIIRNCLNSTGWSLEGKRLAAEQLGISESTLYRRLKQLGLSKKK